LRPELIIFSDKNISSISRHYNIIIVYIMIPNMYRYWNIIYRVKYLHYTKTILFHRVSFTEIKYHVHGGINKLKRIVNIINYSRKMRLIVIYCWTKIPLYSNIIYSHLRMMWTWRTVNNGRDNVYYSEYYSQMTSKNITAWSMHIKWCKCIMTSIRPTQNRCAHWNTTRILTC